MISPEQWERALAFAKAHGLDPDTYLRQCELTDRLISEVIAEEQFLEKSRAWFTRTPIRPTPTKGELRIAIKTHGFSWATRNLEDIDEQAILDGFHGREHTKGQRDYWRLGRELAGLDKP